MSVWPPFPTRTLCRSQIHNRAGFIVENLQIGGQGKRPLERSQRSSDRQWSEGQKWVVKTHSLAGELTFANAGLPMSAMARAAAPWPPIIDRRLWPISCPRSTVRDARSTPIPALRPTTAGEQRTTYISFAFAQKLSPLPGVHCLPTLQVSGSPARPTCPRRQVVRDANLDITARSPREPRRNAQVRARRQPPCQVNGKSAWLHSSSWPGANGAKYDAFAHSTNEANLA